MKVTPSPSLSWEPYSERTREFERYLIRQFNEMFAPWRVNFELEAAPFNMREREKGFVVSAAMPGFTGAEIEVRVEPWRMFLQAKHEESRREPTFEEHREFTRWIEFPAEVNPETAKAMLSNGVLEVTLEKAQTARKVEVHPRVA
jgi:HSP20 family molecular chaperone IbpA